MRLTGTWLTRPETQDVMSTLTEAGYRALFVGGAVRNALLGQPVSDIDIATDALPEVVCDLVKAAGLRPVPTGIDHGTVTVVSAGRAHEVTTLRRDIETDGRRAIVAFSTKVEDDAARRDFTMNAIYAEADGTLLDPLGGLRDVLARRVRFIGSPEDRIREDYLRILRFFRFHAWYGHPDEGLDPDGLAACSALSGGIETLARERVGHEMLKMLAAPDPAPAMASMATVGVLARALPGAVVDALAPLVHLEGDLAADAIRRLAVLGGTDPVAALRLSRADASRLAAIRSAAEGTAGPAELGWRLGPDVARDALLVRAALTGAALPLDWQAEVERGGEARFPVAAADLMPGLQGRDLGARLAQLERRWIDSGLTATREDLLGRR